VPVPVPVYQCSSTSAHHLGVSMLIISLFYTHISGITFLATRIGWYSPVLVHLHEQPLVPLLFWHSSVTCDLCQMLKNFFSSHQTCLLTFGSIPFYLFPSFSVCSHPSVLDKYIHLCPSVLWLIQFVTRLHSKLGDCKLS